MRPILFKIGSPEHGFAIHSFGVLLMFAILAAFFVAMKSAAKRTANKEKGAPSASDIVDVSQWMIFAGIFGARLLFIILDWGSYKGKPATWFAIWEGGISFHGALIGGMLALIAYCSFKKISFLKVADIFAPAVMIGYAIGRIGCLLNGCCYGAPTSAPWGVRFYDHGGWTSPSHPTQLYASILSLLFFGILLWMDSRRKFDGQLLAWYLIFAAIERFLMEIWRANVTSSGLYAFGLTDVQYLCIVLALAGTILIAILHNRRIQISTNNAEVPNVGAAH